MNLDKTVKALPNTQKKIHILEFLSIFEVYPFKTPKN